MNQLMQAHQSARAKINEALPRLDAGDLGLTTRALAPAGRRRTVDGTGHDRVEAVRRERRGRGVGPAGRPRRSLRDDGAVRWHGRSLARNCSSGARPQKLPLAGVNWEVYGAPATDPAKQETYLYAKLA